MTDDPQQQLTKAFSRYAKFCVRQMEELPENAGPAMEQEFDLQLDGERIILEETVAGILKAHPEKSNEARRYILQQLVFRTTDPDDEDEIVVTDEIVAGMVERNPNMSEKVRRILKQLRDNGEGK